MTFSGFWFVNILTLFLSIPTFIFGQILINNNCSNGIENGTTLYPYHSLSSALLANPNKYLNFQLIPNPSLSYDFFDDFPDSRDIVISSHS